MPRLLLTLVTLTLSGCVSQQIDAYKEALEEPVEVWEEKVARKDDPLETMVEYSTEQAIFDLKSPFTGERLDAFVRGARDKQTGIATMHGYLYIVVNNPSWPRPYQINFGKPLQTRKLNIIGKDVDCSGSDVWGGCRYTYHATFPIPISEVKRLEAANYTLEDMQTVIWKFRMKFQAYEDANHGLPVQEMLAIYRVMLDDGAFFVD